MLSLYSYTSSSLTLTAAKSLQSCLLCATPQMAAHQAPPSLGFSKQEHWSGLPFPSPMYESEKWNEVAQSCPTLGDPMDCSLPGFSVHGILQARMLEWGAPILPSIYGHVLNMIKHQKQEMERVYLEKMVIIPVTRWFTLPLLIIFLPHSSQKWFSDHGDRLRGDQK